MKKYLTLENLWIYIIKLLSEAPNGEMYAYEIKKALHLQFGLRPATVTVYSVLYRMEKEGLLQSRSTGTGLGRLSKRYYTVTDKGMRELQQAVDFIDEVRSKLQMTKG
ncbi:MAG TPA: PadR family transcriptional regulator [Thermoprotei archaeon]|nr:PadR family transcriptional regulator [Thermoprotei archaeon]